MTLTLSLIPSSSQGVFGKESKLEPCWVNNSRHYLEIWETYSLPPAWENFDSNQEELPVLKLEA
jgi:hypothetical protein